MPLPTRSVEPRTADLGHSVQQSAQEQGLAALVLLGHLAAVHAALGARRDEDVADVEDERARRKPEGERVGAAQRIRLLGELERDRADERAAAEAEHEARDPRRRARRQGDHGPDHERRARDKAPQKGLGHEA